MKRIIALVCKAMWGMTTPVRRPLMARLDAHVSGLIAGTVNARMMPTLVDALAVSGRRLERIEETLAKADRTASDLAEEMDLVLNGLSREVFRLQAQVEALRRAVEQQADRMTGNGLSLLDGSEDGEPVRRSNAPERSMVG